MAELLSTSAQGKHPEKIFTKISDTEEQKFIKTGKIGSLNPKLGSKRRFRINQEETIVGEIAKATKK